MCYQYNIFINKRSNSMENNDNISKTIKFKPEYSGFKGEIMRIIFIFLLGIFVYFAPKPIELSRYIKDQRIYLIISGILCFVALVKYFKLKIYISTHKYVLTQQRLTCESGFMSKKVSNLELWRVVDIELKQSAIEYTTGGCTIVLTTQDLSDPILYIKGLSIDAGKNIYDTLTNYIALATKTGGITRMM